MDPDTVAALLVYENTWARPVRGRRPGAGGELIASARIPAPDIIDSPRAARGTDD